MRVSAGFLLTELRRSVFSMRFVICVLLLVAMEMLTQAILVRDSGYPIDEILYTMYDGTGSADILLCLLPLLPFAVSYAKDMEDNALGFYMVRIRTGPFVAARFFAACLSAFLCVALSFLLLFVTLRCMGHPPAFDYDPESLENFKNMGGYKQLLDKGGLATYLIFYTMDRGLSAAMMAACAVCLSTVYPNALFTFAAPVSIFFLAMRFICPGGDPIWMDPYTWIGGTYDAPGGGYMTFLCKISVALLVCAVYGGLSVFFAVRRWHYE